MDRAHYEKETKIRELWLEEVKLLRKLSDNAYEVYRLESILVNNYGEVKVDKTPITVFGVKPGTYLSVKIMWDKIEVLDNDYTLLTSVPRPYTKKVQEVPWIEVFKGYIKKPRSVTHSQFAKMLPKELRDYISIEDLESRRERISACINWLRVYKIYVISERLERSKDNSTISMITEMLHVMNGHGYSYKNELNESYTPKEIKESETSLDKYALLSKAGV